MLKRVLALNIIHNMKQQGIRSLPEQLSYEISKPRFKAQSVATIPKRKHQFSRCIFLGSHLLGKPRS